MAAGGSPGVSTAEKQLRGFAGSALTPSPPARESRNLGTDPGPQTSQQLPENQATVPSSSEKETTELPHVGVCCQVLQLRLFWNFQNCTRIFLIKPLARTIGEKQRGA